MIGLFWRVYYWLIICLALLVLLSPFYFPQEKPIETNLFAVLYDFIFIVLFYVSILGLRGYVYQKKYFSQLFWIFIFWLFVIELIGESVYNYQKMDETFLLFFIFLPYWYALWKYAFKMNEIWNGKNNG